MAEDLWRRRRWLAVPLFAVYLAGALRRVAFAGARERSVRAGVHALRGRIHFVRNIHDPSVLEKVRALAPDLGLVYGSPWLRPALFEIPTLGTLGIHHGRMPDYRGKKTMFWAIYNGEYSVGVTIQKISAGLDTGQVIKQGEVPVGRRLPGAIWRRLEDLGLDLYVEAILEVQRGIARFHTLPGPEGRLYRDPAAGDLLRFWWRCGRRVLAGPRGAGRPREAT